MDHLQVLDGAQSRAAVLLARLAETNQEIKLQNDSIERSRAAVSKVSSYGAKWLEAVMPTVAELHPKAQELGRDWQDAYQAALVDLETTGVDHGLVKLVSWPDLIQVPVDMVPDITRICALLWHKSTASLLISRRLDLPKQSVGALLKVLYDFGCVQYIGAETMLANTAADRLDDVATLENTAKSGFLSRFWQRIALR